MKNLKFLILFLILSSCASNESKDISKNSNQLNLEDKIQGCHNGNGLACSQVAYYYRTKKDSKNELNFNQKGCELKDESACFNLNDSKQFNGYAKSIWFKLNFYRDQIASSYKPKVNYNIPRREIDVIILLASIKFYVNDQGAPEKVFVQVSNMKALEFEKCAEAVVKKIKFPPPVSKEDQKEFIFEKVLRYKESFLEEVL